MDSWALDVGRSKLEDYCSGEKRTVGKYCILCGFCISRYYISDLHTLLALLKIPS